MCRTTQKVQPTGVGAGCGGSRMRTSENGYKAKFAEQPFRNCLGKREGRVDDARSWAREGAIRAVHPMVGGGARSPVSRPPTSEEDRGPATPARSSTPSSARQRAAALGGSAAPRLPAPGGGSLAVREAARGRDP